MSDPRPSNQHKAMTVEQLRDYLEWHVQNGRGHYIAECRANYLMVPPQNEQHDDETQTVFVRGEF